MEEKNNKKILVILTGGTICSFENEKNERSANTKKAEVKIISSFRKSKSPFNNVEFECVSPLDILSENMTLSTWNTLLDTFRSIKNQNDYKGIILLHGTDTLAFTASMLSIMLSGFKIPVILVSSQLPLDSQKSNGNINFKASVELIMNGIKPNVYAIYKNTDGKIYLHYGARLCQCENFSNDFFSKSRKIILDPKNAKHNGRSFKTNSLYLNKITSFTKKVLYITPFVGIDYNSFNLENISAVVHGTYHSDTVCVERSNKKGSFTSSSILEFRKKCKDNNVDLFITPCNPQAYFYESTGDALENGISPITNLTTEMAYIKTLIGCELNLKGKELKKFIDENINNESF